jgi:outer membrane immunogenic protein
LSSGGFIGGGQLGYNYQFGPSLVAGIEADIQGIAGSHPSGALFDVVPRPFGFPPDTLVSALSATKNIDYAGTVRGRLGYVIAPAFLIYGTGDTGFTNVAGFSHVSTTRGGWTAGGGGEWMFLPNCSAKAEYLFYDLGTVTYTNGPLVSFLNGTSTVNFINISRSSVRFNGNIVRAGLNYHFNWGPPPVVSKY